MEKLREISELMKTLGELRDLYEELHQLIRVMQHQQNKIITMFSNVVSSALLGDLNAEKEINRVRNIVAEIAREVLMEVEHRLRKYL